ncbi:2-hydroxyacyl-CoA dehydratase subunit D [Thermodesulfobacteriota bacterium]
MENRRTKTEKSVKGLQATRKIWPGTKAYRQEMVEHREKGGLIGWIGGDTATTELLYAFDILPQHIDSMATNFSAKQVSQDFIVRAEAWGFPRDFCSYYKTDVGYLLSSVDDYPQIESVAWPKPDLMIGGPSVCFLHPHGIQFLQRFLNTPAFVFDSPKLPYRMAPDKDHTYIGCEVPYEIEDHFFEYGLKQQKRCVAFLEKVSGKKLDMGKLKEAVRLSKYTNDLWLRIDALRANVPAPMGATDIMSLMLVQFLWAGSHRGIDIYEQALKEIKDKVARGEGAVPEEKFRILFEGLPPWYSLGLFNYIQDHHGAVSVVETYPLNWTYSQLDPDYPLESLVKKRFSTFYTNNARDRADTFIRRMRAYGVEGFIIWSDMCCKFLNLFSRYLKQRVETELNIPGIILDADQCDVRDYNEVLLKNRIDAFFETLESGKKKRSLSA